MPRQNVTKTQAPGSNADAGVVIAWTAADPVNMEQFKLTGKELVIARNTDGAAPHNVTVTSTDDPYGRRGDITNHAIVANGFAVFGPLDLAGWRQGDGNLFLNADSALVSFAVIVL